MNRDSAWQMSIAGPLSTRQKSLTDPKHLYGRRKTTPAILQGGQCRSLKSKCQPMQIFLKVDVIQSLVIIKLHREEKQLSLFCKILDTDYNLVTPDLRGNVRNANPVCLSTANRREDWFLVVDVDG